MMAVKSANLYARIEPDLKEQAEQILSALGIPASNAITMFYQQIVLQGGLPFEVKNPCSKPLSMDDLTEEELDAELEKGLSSIKSGRTKPAIQAYEELRRKYDL